jgi:hypothetical protein
MIRRCPWNGFGAETADTSTRLSAAHYGV